MAHPAGAPGRGQRPRLATLRAAAAALLVLHLASCLAPPDAATWAAEARPDRLPSSQDMLRQAPGELGQRRLLTPGDFALGSGNEVLLTAAAKGDVDAITQLIAAGADVDATDSHGNTPLIVASEHGHLTAVRLLVDSRADINKQGQHGHTALIVAAMMGEVDVLRFLTEVGADIEVVNDEGDTALKVAVRQGDYRAVDALLDAGAKIDGLDRKRWTPLMHAASSGLERIAKLLIENGADVNARTASGSTPLHIAAAHGFAKIIEMLLDAGADIDAPAFANGNTPLLTAAWNGQHGAVRKLLLQGADKHAYARKYLGVLHRAAQFPDNSQVLQLLLDAGVYINTPSEFGSTPVNEAARYGNRENVEFLLAKEADPALNGVPICGCMDVEPDSEDRSCPPGHCSTKSDMLDLRRLFDTSGGNRTLQDAVAAGDYAEVEAFIQQGADVDGAESYSEPPLHIAAARGLSTIIDILVAAGADVNAQDISGWTPLTLAASLGHSGAIEALDAGGADLDAWDGSEHTALMHACVEGRLASVRALLAAGAAVDLASVDAGQTALHKVCRYGHIDVAGALLDGGANASVEDAEGRTPLHFAAMKVGTEEIIRMLIDEGGDVNAATHHGAPPIEFAAFYGNVRGVQYLLSKGADASIGFQDGTSTDEVCGCLRLAGEATEIRCPEEASCQTADQIAEIEALMGQRGGSGSPAGGAGRRDPDPSLTPREVDSFACESLPDLLQRLECAASADPTR